jgi:hypothetical protein
LTPQEAQKVFEAMAGKGGEIAFRWLAEGCECRAQLMIEHMEVMGIDPGRAWALSVGRRLVVPHPTLTGKSIKWTNHVAPTVAVTGAEHGVLVIDPSLSSTGPMPISEWARAMQARSIEVSDVPLSQEGVLRRQSARALQGQDLDAVIFTLERGKAPIPEVGGSGFRLAADPAEGPSAFARSEMVKLLEKQRQMREGRP